MPLVTKTFADIITFTRASSGTYFDATGTLQSAGNNVARFDYDPSTLAPRGFLIEEQRVNSIRNNTMVGAVAGTPGTDPNNWLTSNTGSGVTRQIVGTGTENGITYVDYRYSGTPSAGTNVAIGFEGTNNISATSGETWTESVYVKLQAGSFTNTTTTLSLLGTDGTNGTESFSSSAITSTPADLRNCRLSITGTLTNALTTNVQPRIRIGYTVGIAFDITLRIGLCQCEKGAFATSGILTSTVAAPRAPDQASVNTLSPWYNASAGTLYAEFNVPSLSPSNGSALVAFNDGSALNRIFPRVGGGVNALAVVTTGGASQASLDIGAYTAGTTAKIATAYATNDFAASQNGGTVATDTSGAIPTVNQFNLGSQNGGTATWLNGWLRRVTYYPRRLTNTELQTLTT